MEKIESNKKTRDYMVDLLRILACLIVIGVHINNLTVTSLDKTRIFWAIIFGDGVTIFFIIMGFFLFKNKSFTKVLKRTCKSIILPAFVLTIIVEAIFPFLDNKVSLTQCLSNINIDFKNIFTNILSWKPTDATGHLWYIFSYLKIILMFPILKLIVSNEKTNKYCILVTIGILLYNIYVTYFNPNYILTPYYLISIEIMYVLLGYEIYKRKDKIKNNYKVTIGALVVLIISFIIRYIMQYFLFKTNITNNRYACWNTGFSCVFAASLIILCLSIQIKNKYIGKTISFIGQRTFVIYLIHYPIVRFFQSRDYYNKVLGLFGHTVETSINMTFIQETVYLFLCISVIFIISLIISIFFYVIKIFIEKGVKNIKLFLCK